MFNTTFDKSLNFDDFLFTTKHFGLLGLMPNPFTDANIVKYQCSVQFFSSTYVHIFEYHQHGCVIWHAIIVFENHLYCY